MSVPSFTKIPSGQQVLDRVQDSLSKVIGAHAAALNLGLTFGSNFQAEYLAQTVTTPAMGWDTVTLNPVRIKTPKLIFLVGQTSTTSVMALPSWTASNGQIQVTACTGLAPSTKYDLTFLLVNG